MKDKILLLLSVFNGLILTFVIYSIDGDVPIKFDMDGTVQNYGNKWTYLIFVVLPVALSICQIMFEAKVYNKINSKLSKGIAGKAIPLLVILTTIIGWLFATIMIKPETKLLDESIYSWLIVAFGAWMIYVTNFYAYDEAKEIKLSWTKEKSVLQKLRTSGNIFGLVGGLIVLCCGVMGVIVKNLIVVLTGLILGVLVSFVVPLLVARIAYKHLPVTTPVNKTNDNKNNKNNQKSKNKKK